MHTFSLHTCDDEHIGFFVMLPDDEGNQSGQFAIKLSSEHAPSQPSILRDLDELAQRDDALFWAVQGEKVALFDGEHNPLGTIRQQVLRVGGKDFILNDLTGAI